MLAVGIDVAEARKGHDLVALDGRRRVVARHRHLGVDELARIVLGELAPDVVCIDAPARWAAPRRRSRVAEAELRAIGAQAFATPADPGDHPFYRWMRAGFEVFAALGARYPQAGRGDPRGSSAEVFPHATAVMLGGVRRPGESKVRFRRRVLDDQGVDASTLAGADQVDAALAALTGIIALGGQHLWLGDPAEGAVLVPVPPSSPGQGRAPRRSVGQDPGGGA